MNWPEIWAHHVEQRLQSGSLWLGAGCRHALFGLPGFGLCNVFKTADFCANKFTLKNPSISIPFFNIWQCRAPIATLCQLLLCA